MLIGPNAPIVFDRGYSTFPLLDSLLILNDLLFISNIYIYIYAYICIYIINESLKCSSIVFLLTHNPQEPLPHFTPTSLSFNNNFDPVDPVESRQVSAAHIWNTFTTSTSRTCPANTQLSMANSPSSVTSVLWINAIVCTQNVPPNALLPVRGRTLANCESFVFTSPFILLIVGQNTPYLE